MQPAHPPVQLATNWRYAGHLAPAPLPRHSRPLPYPQATNWRYGVLEPVRPIVPPIDLKPFATNWRYQIAVG